MDTEINLLVKDISTNCYSYVEKGNGCLVGRIHCDKSSELNITGRLPEAGNVRPSC